MGQKGTTLPHRCEREEPPTAHLLPPHETPTHVVVKSPCITPTLLRCCPVNPAVRIVMLCQSNIFATSDEVGLEMKSNLAYPPRR